MAQIHLRKLNVNDTEILAFLANNVNVWSNLRDKMPNPYSLSDAEAFLALTVTENPTYNFGIEFEGELCGVIGVMPQQDVYRFSGEMGYWIGEQFWGKGIATEAVHLITNYAFETLNLNRVFAGVYHFNKASIRVLEKNGFIHEGVLKKAVFKNGQFHDEWRYGKLRNPT